MAVNEVEDSVDRGARVHFSANMIDGPGDHPRRERRRNGIATVAFVRDIDGNADWIIRELGALLTWPRRDTAATGDAVAVDYRPRRTCEPLSCINDELLKRLRSVPLCAEPVSKSLLPLCAHSSRACSL